MAEGHAKLSLRHEVSIYDALAAIKLYEENMTLHSGYSLIIQNESPTDNDEVVSSTCIYLHLQNSEVRGVCLCTMDLSKIFNICHIFEKTGFGIPKIC